MIFSSLALLASSLSLVANTPQYVYEDDVLEQSTCVEYVIDIDEMNDVGSSWNYIQLSYPTSTSTTNYKAFMFYITQHDGEYWFEYGYSGANSNLYFSFDIRYYVEPSNPHMITYNSPMIYKSLKYDNFTDEARLGDVEYVSMESSAYLHVYFYLLDSDLYADYFEQGDFHDGYQQGYQDGLTVGKLDNQPDIYDTGYTDGLRDGFNQGYEAGYHQGGYDYSLSHGQSFSDLFYAIGDTPVLMLRRLFNFEFFGINLMTVFMSLFTALIVIWIIKKVF